MRKFVFLVCLLAIPAFGQDKAAKPVTISAEQVATLEVPRLKARVAQLEAEKAQKAAAELEKAAQDALLALLEKAGVKRDDLPKYDITQSPDGGLVLTLKPEPKK